MKKNEKRKSTSRNFSIGIIGFGGTGVSVFYHLINKIIDKKIQKTNNIKIHIFDNSKKRATGLAYSQTQDHLILNMRTKTMSIDAKNLDHFASSLPETLTKNPDHYLPRHIFGKYLKKNFKASLENGKKHNIEVQITGEEVVDLTNKNTKFYISTKEGSKSEFDKIILCLGNTPSSDYIEWTGTQGYITSPYLDNLVGKIPKHENVIILGSSLTAIDAALNLQNNSHKGKITLISRNGILPKVQGRTHEYKLKFITPEYLKKNAAKIPLSKIFRLFQKELEMGLNQKIDWSKILMIPDSAVKELKEDIKKSENGEVIYQSILAATTRIIPLIWHSIKKSGRIKFMKEYYSQWCSYRHAMPLINAKKILKMIEANQLNVIGGIKSIAHNKKHGNFTVTYSKNGRSKKVSAKFLINAIGTGYSLKKTSSNLIKKLLAMGVIRENPCGGIDVDFETSSIISKKGKYQKNIYAVGPLTRGVHFYTNSIEMNALYAEKIADLITPKLAK